MAFRLAPTLCAEGYRLEAHDSIGSTNTVALDHARAGDPGKLWVVSSEQESGRGRRGRAWVTPRRQSGRDLCSSSPAVTRLAATLGFVAGLALADALDAVVPQAIASARRRRPARTVSS